MSECATPRAWDRAWGNRLQTRSCCNAASDCQRRNLGGFRLALAVAAADTARGSADRLPETSQNELCREANLRLRWLSSVRLNALFWSPPLVALDPSLDISQYAHTAWTFRNGFLTGAVYTIAQSADGYLWLGTQTGVYRSDGVRAVPFALLQDREGTV
jgi:Two component regulator propeller.